MGEGPPNTKMHYLYNDKCALCNGEGPPKTQMHYIYTPHCMIRNASHFVSLHCTLNFQQWHLHWNCTCNLLCHLCSTAEVQNAPNWGNARCTDCYQFDAICCSKGILGIASQVSLTTENYFGFNNDVLCNSRVVMASGGEAVIVLDECVSLVNVGGY